MIDWDRLTGLRSDIGEDDFREVAELFVEELTEVMDRLTRDPTVATPGDFHFLRGSAANLGFKLFAEHCALAELTLAAGQSVDIPALAALYAASLAEAASILPETAQAA